MPFNIVGTHIREIDPQNEKQLAGLAEQLSHPDYLQQSPPHTLPKTIEAEFAQKEFISWAYDTIRKKYPNSNFRYAVIDHDFEPVHPEGKPLTVPYSFISLFDHKGHTYAGPLFLGIIPCVLQAKGDGHPAEHEGTRHKNMEEPLSGLFTAKDQQRIAQQSVQALLNYPGIDGVISAIPNSRKSRGSRGPEDKAPDLRNAGYFHLLVGGQITDQYRPEFHFPDEWELPENHDPSRTTSPFYLASPLKSNPLSFTQMVTNEPGAYTVFPLLKGKENELINDAEFSHLCNDIRNLGPQYQRLHPERPPGIRATLPEGVALMEELTRLGNPASSAKR